MDDDAQATCDRIEAALLRIERASVATGGDNDLRHRHERLREAAARSLAIVDALIAAHDPDGTDADSDASDGLAKAGRP